MGEQNKVGLPISVKYELTNINVPYMINYLIQNDGSVRVTATIDLVGRNLPEMPRFGMRMELPSSYNKLLYYGRGPWENYSDRKTASFIGIYNDKENQFTGTYISPQEAGYKTDTRWLSLLDENGHGIFVKGLQPICFSALDIHTEDIDAGLNKMQ